MVRKGVIGIPQDGRMTACSYTVKHYEEGSVFGIDGGRISKLAIKIDGKTTCCYDRGWDCEPEDWEAAQLNAEKEVFFLIRYCSEVKEIDTEHFRIIFRGQVYNITFIDNVKYQNKTIKLRAALEKR